MAEATKYLNQKGIQGGIVEVLDFEATDINENDPNLYNRDLSGTKSYPYERTISGFLQTGDANKVITNKGLLYGSLAVLSLLI